MRNRYDNPWPKIQVFSEPRFRDGLDRIRFQLLQECPESIATVSEQLEENIALLPFSDVDRVLIDHGQVSAFSRYPPHP